MPNRVEKIGKNTRKRTERRAQQSQLPNTQAQQSVSVTRRAGGKKKKSFASKIMKYSFGSIAGLGAAAGIASTSDAATIITSLF